MRVKVSQIIQANRLAKEFLVQSQREWQIDYSEIIDSQSTHNAWGRMIALNGFPIIFSIPYLINYNKAFFIFQKLLKKHTVHSASHSKQTNKQKLKTNQ